MPIWLKNVGAISEDVEFVKVSDGYSRFIRKVAIADVDKEVGSDGLKIIYKGEGGADRIMHITDSDYKLRFYDSATKLQVVLNIGGGLLGAANFDVYRDSAGFIIKNNDMRLSYANDVDGPYANYHIYSKGHGGELEWYCHGSN